MLTLFFFPAAPILYAPIPAPPKQQSKTIDFSENQNTIVSETTPSEGLTRVTTSDKTAIAQCSPDEFKSFFEQFVRNRASHYYINSEVQIRDYQDPSRLLMTISGNDYVDFRIGAIGNRYVYIDPLAKYRGDDELLKKRLKLDYQRSDA
ncbi:MAG: hypothetical protein ACK5Y4_06670 [Pseudanabaena sp.]